MKLIRDGDVAPAIAAAQPGTGVDMLYGIGGTPEGVISAAALKCVGGGIQGRLWPRDDDERRQLVDAGLDPARVLYTNDLVAGEDVFVAATGVTNGPLLARRAVHAGRRGHRLDRHALALGHGAARQRAAVAREALRADGLRVPLQYRLPKGAWHRCSVQTLAASRAPSPARRRPVRAALFIFARW